MTAAISGLKPRGVLIAGNWKMNHGLQSTEQFIGELGSTTAAKLGASGVERLKAGGLKACICPPMLSLGRARQLASQLPFPLTIGSQNVHWEKSGAFTGEVSASMLLEQGISTTLVGHSERRQYFGETDETVRKRTESALAQGLRVILCIGETRAEREAGRTAQVIQTQLSAVFQNAGQGASTHLDGRLVIAYEPVWAIGTGLTATPDQAEEAHQLVRKFLWDRAGMNASSVTPILYGGSVTPENVISLLACPNVDGGLVGGASLKVASFLELLAAGATALGDRSP